MDGATNGVNRTIAYVTNTLGQVLVRAETDNGQAGVKRQFFYLNGRQIGNAGDDGDPLSAQLDDQTDYGKQLADDRVGVTQAGTVINANSATPMVLQNAYFDTFEPYDEASVSQSGSSYTVVDGDSLPSIALTLWGDPSLWYVLAEANGLDAGATLTAGMLLTVPGNVTVMHNNSGTYQAYDPANALGNTTPTLPREPQPPAPRQQGCGMVGEIIAIAVATVVAAIVAPYAVAEIANLSVPGATLATATAATFAGSGALIPFGMVTGGMVSVGTAVAVSTTLAGGLGGLGAFEAGALVGAASDLAMQGVRIAAGNQGKFNWGELGADVLAGGIERGLGLTAGAAARQSGGNIWQAVTRSAAGSLVQQGANIAFKVQKAFDWTGLAVASVEGAASYGMDNWAGGHTSTTDTLARVWGNHTPGAVVTGAAGILAGAVTRTLITGQGIGKSLREEIPGVIGSTIGNAIGQDILAGLGTTRPLAPKGDPLAALTQAPPDVGQTQYPTCFPAGTWVHTEQGLKPIEQIAVGDMVAARDEYDQTAPVKWRRVENRFEHFDIAVLHLTIVHPDGERETLSTTCEHPFFVDGAWRPAGQLTVGDRFARVDRQISVLMAVETAPERHTVYNLTVEEDHTYFVGAAGIWVHNKYPLEPSDWTSTGRTSAPKHGFWGKIGDWVGQAAYSVGNFLGFDGQFGYQTGHPALSWGGLATAVSNRTAADTGTSTTPDVSSDETTTVVVVGKRDPYQNGLIVDAVNGNGSKLWGELTHGRWLPDKSWWTEHADTLSHYNPETVGWNYLADRTSSTPVVSNYFRYNAAMSEGQVRGTAHFVINAYNDVNGMVKDPFGTAVSAGKAMIASDIYMAKAYFGFADPLGDGYKAVKSAIDGENAQYEATFKTHGLYAATVQASANGTEFGENVVLAVVPGTDVIEGARIIGGAAKVDETIEALNVAKSIAAETGPITQSIDNLRSFGLKDAHHVIQDAAVRDLPGYDTKLAPGVQLQGPSTLEGSPHYNATQAQRIGGGGTYGAERQIAYKSLRAAGYTDTQATQAIREADAYFSSIGVDERTPTRIPGNRTF